MGEPITDNNNENNADGSQSSSACSDQNGSCNGLEAKNFLQLNLNKVTPDIDYLTLLLKDKKQLAAFPNVFLHIERLLDDEINRVRVALFQCKFTREPLQLPDPVGEVTMRQEKVFVPIKMHPEYNFVGRILGPRGMTAKQLEAETGCKIMVRGKGSMRDKKKEDMNKGKANWEHLQEDLHVLIQCEDTPNRIEIKMKRAMEEVNKLLVPSPEGEDELKKKQLMELAIINGTYRTAANQLQNDKSQTVIAAAAAAATNYLERQRLWANQSLQIPNVIYPSAITPNATATAVQSLGFTGAPLILQSATSQNANVNTDRHSVNGVSAAAVNNQQTANSAAFAAAAALQIAQLNGLNTNTNAAMFGQLPQTAVVPNSAATIAATNGTVTSNQAIIDYQMLLNSMQCDPNLLAQIQQQQQIATFLQASGAIAPNSTAIGVSPANEVAAANFSQLINLNSQNTGALFSQQRRFLGQNRDHPYVKRETQ